jgi:hypothetical protein
VLGQSLEDFGHSPQIAVRAVLPGDVLILASDGLETLTMVQVQNFIRTLLPQGVAAVADGLIKAVSGIGGNRNYQDNATLIVVQADGLNPVRTTAVSENKETNTSNAAAAKNSAAPAQVLSASVGNARAGSGIAMKVLLGVAVALAGLAAIFIASGRDDMLRGVVKLVPFPQEQGLQPRPAISPESDSLLPQQRAPKSVTQTPGG